jgi:glycosyltransferase involved in cell wall biosynthesis
MRIAVNLLPFRDKLAGAGRYTQNILRELVEREPKTEYIFFVTPPAAARFAYAAPNVSCILVSHLDSIAARVAYEQSIFSMELAGHNPDVLFTPSVAIPIAWRGRKVTVIYDMIAEHRKVTKYPPLRNAYIRAMSRYAAHHSDAVITISENSRREISRFARMPPEKIFIAPPATDLQRVTAPETLMRVRETYHLPERFILYLGTLEPGKNLPHLVRAFGELKRAHSELEHHLVLAGAQGWGVRDIENEIQKSDATGFHLIGFVEENDLPALYSLADLFLYPSLYEGFGMPPLEAMACGTPVILSNVSSLPEVLGDLWTGKVAGLMVEPHNVTALANAMARVLTDDALHERLRVLGLKRAREFSWATSATTVAQTLTSVARPGSENQ